MAKLSTYFEVYLEALNEMSERYLQNARRYAAILKLEPEAFPKLRKRLLPRGSVLKAPSD